MEKKEYLSACEQAKKWAEEYYDNDAPSVSDYEYDALMRQLRQAEAEHPEWVTPESPTQHVGGSSGKSSFAKVEHAVPMLSLLDITSREEVEDFVNKYPGKVFSVEPKIDGLSMSVTYENGVLVRTETRGDGYIGEDITENARHIVGIPTQIPSDLKTLEVRCECYMPVAEFERINAENEKLAKRVFVNPRNAAAGILRTKDVGEVARAKLHAFAFNVQRFETVPDYDGEELPFGVSHTASLAYLRSYGFSVVETYATGRGGVMGFIEYIGKHRDDLPYWIDGAVVKLDSIPLREQIDGTSKYPNWARAFKYPPEEKETVVSDIILQTGRTGRVTPVAVFDPPVFLEGSTVSKATLHNPEFIESLDLDIGDRVLVHKAQSIIPEIMRVVKKVGNSHFDMLSCTCPSCGCNLVRNETGDGEDETGAYCVNPSCPAQLSRHLEFWGSRECMDIAGFGPAVIDRFISLGWLDSINDIYRLADHRDEMKKLDGFGAKSADKLLAAIEESKSRDIDRLIKALGMPGVGRHIGKELAKRYPDMWAIASCTKADFATLPGIGDVSAVSLYTFFHDIDNQRMLRAMQALGVNFKSKSYGAASAEGALSGLTLVITGTLPSMTRDEAKALIERHGGKVSGSVSKKTYFLLTGEAAGSKLDKAKALGVKIISESELMSMIGGES